MKVSTDGAIHRYSRRSPAGHVPLHCLWAFGKSRGHLNEHEHTHVEGCEECSRALQACCRAENFGAVLKEMRRENDDDVSLSDGKPKLKTLYVFPAPIDFK